MGRMHAALRGRHGRCAGAAMPSSLSWMLALPLAIALPAQEEDDTRPVRWSVAETVARLESAELGDVAWAGHFVQRDRLRALVPAVRSALARLRGRDDVPGQLARLQLLDALIQLDVRLPGEELMPHAIGCLRVPALILAAKCPEQNMTYFEARMAALGKSPDLEWRVCGNQLAALRDPRFVARCLRQLEFAIDITVRDEVPQPPPSSSG